MAAICCITAGMGAVACSGEVGSGEAGGGDEPTAGAGSTSSPKPGNDSSGVTPRRVGVAPLLRLTAVEYDNTVRDLLGDGTSHAVSFPPQQFGEGGVPKNEVVSPLEAKQYQIAAEALAKSALPKLDKLLPCSTTRADDACADEFIANFGKRAFRRPVSAEETQSLKELYNVAKGTLGYDFPERIRVLLAALLQSDGFLYKGESSTPSRAGEAVALTQYEVASRLSYFLWQSMPDDTLLAEADAGRLKTTEQVVAQAFRMLQDPRAEATVQEFFGRWLELDKLSRVTKDPNVYPDFNERLRTSMRAETEAFARHVVLRGDGRFETLLTAPYSFINEPLANLYGVTGPKGSPMIKTELDKSQRSGILTHASVLSLHANADQGSPILRGKFIRERVLCDRVDPPPASLEIVVPVVDDSLPTRERFAAHSNSTACSGCHVKMDPIGFGFGNYNGIGAFVTMDGGKPVDASGVLTGTDVDGAFVGAVALARILADSDQARDCFVKQWFRYAFSRGEAGDDESSVAFATEVFRGTDYNIRELILSLTATDAFRYRKAAPGEGQSQ